MGAHVGGHGHKPEMPFMKRGFPDHENQFSLFFQGYVRATTIAEVKKDPLANEAPTSLLS